MLAPSHRAVQFSGAAGVRCTVLTKRLNGVSCFCFRLVASDCGLRQFVCNRVISGPNADMPKTTPMTRNGHCAAAESVGSQAPMCAMVSLVHVWCSY